MTRTVRRLLLELGIDDVDAVMDIWREEEEERKAQAEEMQQMMGQGDDEEGEGDEAENDEQQATEEAWERRMASIDQLGVELREVSRNGH